MQLMGKSENVLLAVGQDVSCGETVKYPGETGIITVFEGHQKSRELEFWFWMCCSPSIERFH